MPVLHIKKVILSNKRLHANVMSGPSAAQMPSLLSLGPDFQDATLGAALRKYKIVGLAWFPRSRIARYEAVAMVEIDVAIPA